jgi:hypothetical protein
MVYGKEKTNLYWTRAAKAEQKPLVLAKQAQQTNQGRTPFICTLRVPIHLSFNCQQGPPLFSLSDEDTSIQRLHFLCENNRGFLSQDNKNIAAHFKQSCGTGESLHCKKCRRTFFRIPS